MVGRQARILLESLPLASWGAAADSRHHASRASGSRDRGFRFGLVCAALLHSLLLVGSNLSPVPGPAAPTQSEAAVPAIAATPPPAAEAQPTPPAESQPAPAAKAPPDAPALEKELTALLTLPDPSAQQGKPSNPKQSSANQGSGARAGIDLSLPRPSVNSGPSFQGGSAAVNRPPDITRSGENDDFGRGVIRALRATMPSPTGWVGRVTVRFVLSPTGNIAEIRLAGSGGDPIMDQNVVFAARQASFPLPPKSATLSDRSFLVTYVYR